MESSHHQAALAALGRHYLFAPLTGPELESLTSVVGRSFLAGGEPLFYQQDVAEHFYLVGQGQIKLYHTSAEGQEKVVELIGPGQTLAEAVLFMRRPCYPVSASAVREALVYRIPGRAYLPLLRGNPDACMHILGDLSMRLHARLQDVVALTQQNATYRVVHFLLQLMPPDRQPGCRIHLETPKQVIASRLSVKPETLSRIMARLDARGLIKLEGREILIPDPEALYRLGDAEV